MSELLQRLARQYDERPAGRVMHPVTGVPNWVAGFGPVIADVRTLCAHMTAGWPRRDNANNFVDRYIRPGTASRGIGTQLYVAGDGTVARFIDLPRLTFHGEWINGFSVGVETGNLGTTAVPPANGAGGVPHWIQASANAEDIPGAKLWITGRPGAQTEVMPGWWTTAGYAGPAREAVGAGHMLFSEQIMQAWALMARHLFEELELPRNFPLLPHESRSGMIAAASAPRFRRTVLADERAEMVQRTVAAAPINIATANFAVAQAAALQAEYGAAIVPAPASPGAGSEQRHNRAWKAWCTTYRGLHGHGYAGAMRFHKRLNAAGAVVLDAGGNPIWDVNHEHDCPGPLFDFHRVAREVSDYWWYPFDVVLGSSAVPIRPYRRFQRDTPVIEYYFDESEADRTARIGVGVHGANSSPTTFTLDQESPIYAMSNGELVAARFPDPGAGASMAFTLVRHEVYHLPRFAGVAPGAPAAAADRIDYTRPPESVYTLYMHLGRPTGMSFDTVADANPDWLNRLLVRKKECDLGVAFYDDDPAHHGIAAAVWNNRPPGVPQRPTTLEGWRADRLLLDAFLTTLARGDVAVLSRQGLALPGRVLLGDFLGESGVIRAAGPRQHGVRVETFAPDFPAPTFSVIGSVNGWNPPNTLPAPHCVQYEPEWTRTLTLAEMAALFAAGVDARQLAWWDVVAQAQLLEGSLPVAARLPTHGHPFHYEPLAFARWLNGVTWASEWPKYEVTDAAGAPVARPAQPRSRRV